MRFARVFFRTANQFFTILVQPLQLGVEPAAFRERRVLRAQGHAVATDAEADAVIAANSGARIAHSDVSDIVSELAKAE